MLLTFRDGQSALEAVGYNQSEVEGRSLCVSLQTADWRERARAEQDLVRNNTTALFSAVTHSLLGEDFSIPSMSFDMEGRQG